MKNQKDIKRKIKAVLNIKKVTKAMESIANIRLQKAMKSVFPARDYSNELLAFAAQIIKTIDAEKLPNLPLFKSRDPKNALFVVISSDRGLCGFFNNKLLSSAINAISNEKSKGKGVRVIAVGKKGIDFLKRHDSSVVQTYSQNQFEQKSDLAKQLTFDCINEFENKNVDEVYIFYNHFISIGRQEASAMKFLPLLFNIEDIPSHIPLRFEGLFEFGKTFNFPEFIFEPKMEEIIYDLLKRYLETMMLQVLLESNASEHAARMIAMQQSTLSADEMIGDLTMLYNKARQTLITREIIEIVSSAEALNN